MKLVYLDSARPDLAWLRLYYRSRFPEGARNGSKQFLRAVRNLLDHPQIGRPIERSDIREYSIPRIPFSIVYRITDTRIEVLRVWDQRSDPQMRDFNEEQAIMA